MSESEFWGLLQSCVNRCVSGSLSSKIGYCDWFEPKHYYLDGHSPRIMGRVGFVCVRRVADLAFTLFLGHSVNSLEEIQWATLLPPDGATGWLSDAGNRNEIYPSRAVNPPAPTPDATSESN